MGGAGGCVGAGWDTVGSWSNRALLVLHTLWCVWSAHTVWCVWGVGWLFLDGLAALVCIVVVCAGVVWVCCLRTV